MTALTLAVENAALLRRLTAPVESAAALARELGRDKSNLSKSLARLREEGLIDPEGALDLTDQARDLLPRLDALEGRREVDSVEGFIALHHELLSPSRDNPRKDFWSEDAKEAEDALRQDILQNGLLQNLVVRRARWEDSKRIMRDGVAAPYMIVSGERRWRAIGAAIADGDWPEDRPLPCQVIETDDLGHRLRALAENLQRRDLSPIEEARAFRALRDLGLETADIADRVSVTPRQVQMRLQLLELDEADQARMALPRDDPAHLGVKEARALVQTPRERQVEPAAPEQMDVEEFTSPAATLPPRPGFDALPARGVLMLVELADKWLRGPAEAARGDWVRVGETYPDHTRTAQMLIELGGGFLSGGKIDGTLAALPDDAEAWLRAQSLWPEDAAAFGALDRARMAVGEKVAIAASRTDRYATPWINEDWTAPRPVASTAGLVPPPPPATPPEPSPEERDEQALTHLTGTIRQRFSDRRQSRAPDWADMPAEQLAKLAVKAAGKGDYPGLGFALAALVVRAGYVGATPMIADAFAISARFAEIAGYDADDRRAPDTVEAPQ